MFHKQTWTSKHWNRLSREVVQPAPPECSKNKRMWHFGHSGIRFYDSMNAARRAQVPCSILGRLGKTVGWECESWVKHRETEAAEKLHSHDRNEITILSLSPTQVSSWSHGIRNCQNSCTFRWGDAELCCQDPALILLMKWKQKCIIRFRKDLPGLLTLQDANPIQVSISYYKSLIKMACKKKWGHAYLCSVLFTAFLTRNCYKIVFIFQMSH